MGTSETPGQLTKRLEMGQGRTVHFFIAWPEESRWWLFFVMAGAALLVVTGQGGFDHGVGDLGREDFVHFDDFALELFVILKKSADHGEFVGRQLAGFVVGVVFGIGGGDGDDFVVDGTGINHGHQANRARVHDGKRSDRDLAEDQDVERVVIFGERLRNETVVSGIVHGGVEHAIHFYDAAGFVEFVFDAGAERDFDDGLKFVWNVFAGTEVVPGMHLNSSENNCNEVVALSRPQIIEQLSGAPTLRLWLVRRTALRVHLDLQGVVEGGAAVGFCGADLVGSELERAT